MRSNYPDPDVVLLRVTSFIPRPLLTTVSLLCRDAVHFNGLAEAKK
ncbi:hypothetical protein [Enterobacter chuandaensis]